MSSTGDEYLRGKDGRPIVDRFGRPIRRRPRPGDGPTSGGHSRPAASPSSSGGGRHRQPDAPQPPTGGPGSAGNSHIPRQPDQSGRTSTPFQPQPQPRRASAPLPPQNETRFDPRPRSGNQGGAQGSPHNAQNGQNSSYQGGYQGGNQGAPSNDYPHSPQNQPTGQPRPGGQTRPSRYAPPPGHVSSRGGIGPGGRPAAPTQRPQSPQSPKEPSRWRRLVPTRKPGKKPRWGRRIGGAFALIFLLFIGLMIWVDTTLNRIDALTNYPGRPAAGSGTNWLLVGSDSRDGLTEAQQQELSTGGDTGGGRTDSIILVHIPTFGKATMVSIPRDSYVDIPGQGKNKVNAAFALGGPQLLQQTVEQATGLRIDHYAEIGFGGFANVVDAVGGVNICVEQPMDDPLAGINLQPGCQKMNGATALGFVRSRHSMDDGDIGRARNQRTFLAALVKKALSPTTLLNPFKFFPLVSRTKDAFTVNTGDHVWDLARLGFELSRSPNTESVPVGSYQTTDVGDVIVWDDQGAAQMFNSLK